jgi:KDO2-lipid IV(A) lauroyltransferase
MELILRLLSKLPLPVLYRLSDLVYLVVHRMFRWRRDVAAANLRRAFPEKSEAELAAILDRSYRNLADLIAEIVWAGGATREQLAERVQVENADVINTETRAGRSVLLMTAHFCNWEWQVLAGNLALDAPMYPVYKPQRSQALDRFLGATRSRFGGEPIAHKALTRFLLRRRSEAHVYAMVADQTPTQDEPRHWTTFLNQDTTFFVGADAIARILQAPVLFVEMRRIARGRYAMRVSRLADPPYAKGSSIEVIERYARALERQIRASPADWLWVHRKWKYPRPQPASSASDAGCDAEGAPVGRRRTNVRSEASEPAANPLHPAALAKPQTGRR